MFLSYCSDLLPLYFPRETVAVHWGTRTKPQRVQCSAWLGDINNSERWQNDVVTQPAPKIAWPLHARCWDGTAAVAAAAQPVAAAAQPVATAAQRADVC